MQAKTKTEQEGLATIQEAMEFLSVSRKTVDRLRKDNRLKTVILTSGTRRITWSSLKSLGEQS